MLELKLQYFGHLMQRADSLENTDAGKDWRQEKGATEDETVIASPTQWTWIWKNSSRYYRTEEPKVLQSTRLRRVKHNLATEQQHEVVFIAREKTSCYKNITEWLPAFWSMLSLMPSKSSWASSTLSSSSSSSPSSSPPSITSLGVMIASYISQRYSNQMMPCIDWLLINLLANDPGKGLYPNRGGTQGQVYKSGQDAFIYEDGWESCGFFYPLLEQQSTSVLMPEQLKNQHFLYPRTPPSKHRWVRHDLVTEQEHISEKHKNINLKRCMHLNHSSIIYDCQDREAT